jgi:hypothetical protein
MHAPSQPLCCAATTRRFADRLNCRGARCRGCCQLATSRANTLARCDPDPLRVALGETRTCGVRAALHLMRYAAWAGTARACRMSRHTFCFGAAPLGARFANRVLLAKVARWDPFVLVPSVVSTHRWSVSVDPAPRLFFTSGHLCQTDTQVCSPPIRGNDMPHPSRDHRSCCSGKQPSALKCDDERDRLPMKRSSPRVFRSDAPTQNTLRGNSWSVGT